MVLDIVPSLHSKRNYTKLWMTCLSFVPADLSPALLMEYRTTMDHLSPSTINVRLSAIRKLVGEARRNGMIGFEEAVNLPTSRTYCRRELVSGTGLPGNRRRSFWRCLIDRLSRANEIA